MNNYYPRLSALWSYDDKLPPRPQSDTDKSFDAGVTYAREEQGGIARKANARENRAEWKMLTELLKEYCTAEGRQMVRSKSFAKSVLNDAKFKRILESRLSKLDSKTKKRLAGREAKWPGNATVARAVAAILEECGEAKSHS